VAGIGVDLIDFPGEAVPGGVMTSKLLDFALLYGPGVGLIGLMALLVLARFPLSHTRVVEVQRLLANRRGLIHSEVKPGEDARDAASAAGLSVSRSRRSDEHP
jgi:hypothetical protein